MRLIDKDKLIEVLTNERVDYAKAIINAPIVEAIPIEWIENWSKQFYKYINGTEYYMGEGYDSVWDVINEWRKENDKR